MLTVAFAESTVSRTQIPLWYNRFKEGREEVIDDTDELIARVLQQPMKKKMILDNLRITIGAVADDVDISFSSRQAIFTHVLGMKPAAKKCSKIDKFCAKTMSHGRRSDRN